MKISKKIKGVTLIEVVVAILLIGIFFGVAMTLFVTTFKLSETNRARFQATYLAQECLELARNLRDTAWKQFRPFDCAFKNSSGNFINGWGIKNEVVKSEEELGGDNYAFQCQKDWGVLISDNDGDEKISLLYGDSDAKNFTRKISVFNPDDPDDESRRKVTCQISWGDDREITMSQILTNWK